MVLMLFAVADGVKSVAESGGLLFAVAIDIVPMLSAVAYVVEYVVEYDVDFTCFQGVRCGMQYRSQRVSSRKQPWVVELFSHCVEYVVEYRVSCMLWLLRYY
jgi:hypothetical protein